MLVTVNDRLKFEIEIIHDLSCHPIVHICGPNTVIVVLLSVFSAARSKKKKGPAGAADKKAAVQAAVPKTESKKVTAESDVVPEATEYVFVTVNMK